MINFIKNKTNNQYRTATIIREDRTQYKFRYRKVEPTLESKNEFVTGLRNQNEEFLIATTDQFNFPILSLQLNIDNVRYKILDTFKENAVNSNGLFRDNFEVVTFIRVGK